VLSGIPGAAGFVPPCIRHLTHSPRAAASEECIGVAESYIGALLAPGIPKTEMKVK
jgi:hypothetical protein